MEVGLAWTVGLIPLVADIESNAFTIESSGCVVIFLCWTCLDADSLRLPEASTLQLLCVVLMFTSVSSSSSSTLPKRNHTILFFILLCIVGLALLDPLSFF